MLADQLIRDAVDSRRRLSVEELRHVLEHVADVPFATRPVKAHREVQGREYLGYRLEGKLPSLVAHLAKRVLKDEQWPVGTTPQQYLADLRQAIRSPEAQLYTYRYGIGARAQHCLGILAPNHVQGPKNRALLWVVYSATYGRITTGYQIGSALELDVLKESAETWARIRHR